VDLAQFDLVDDQNFVNFILQQNNKQHLQ